MSEEVPTTLLPRVCALCLGLPIVLFALVGLACSEDGGGTANDAGSDDGAATDLDDASERGAADDGSGDAGADTGADTTGDAPGEQGGATLFATTVATICRSSSRCRFTTDTLSDAQLAAIIDHQRAFAKPTDGEGFAAHGVHAGVPRQRADGRRVALILAYIATLPLGPDVEN